MVDSNRKNKSTPKIPILEQYLETESHAKQLEKHDANQLIALMKKTITGHENINKTMRQQIYTLDTLKGYDSLGYDSLYDCLKNTLNDKKRFLPTTDKPRLPELRLMCLRLRQLAKYRNQFYGN